MVRVKALTEKRVGRFVCGPKLFSVLSYSRIFNFFCAHDLAMLAMTRLYLREIASFPAMTRWDFVYLKCLLYK